MTTKPTIDVTMLAFREPDIAKNIRSWLPHAKRIIVVVGASGEVKRIGIAPDDEDTVRAVQSVCDPDRQIRLIVRNGEYWKNKNEMQLAAVAEARADLVWQVDADEFYLKEHIEKCRQEVGNDTCELACMPHIVFWRSTKQILVHKKNGRRNETWIKPARIWRRKEGEAFMHLPYNRIRRRGGPVQEAGSKVLPWGRCYHMAWVRPETIRFRIQFHQARGARLITPRWWEEVWLGGKVPERGVHPMLDGMYPEPYSGPLPEALR